MSRYDQFIDAGESLRESQNEVLRSILSTNANCRYGLEYGFAKINGADDYRALPFMTYDHVASFQDFWSDPGNFCEGRLVARFLTSGSSSTPKKIPVTSQLVRQKAAAFAVYWDSIYAAHPTLKTGNFIANFADSGGSTRGADGVLETAETTFWNQRMQGFQNSARWPVGRHLTAIESPELRYYAAVRLALQSDLHCMMSLNPSTLVRFCTTIRDYAGPLSRGLEAGDWGHTELDEATHLPDKLASALTSDSDAARRLKSAVQTDDFQLRAIWPTLELVICWLSGLVEPYLRLLRRHTDGIDYRDYITQASECMMAIPVDDNQSGGLLAHTSHFFEFIPERNADEPRPETLGAWELTPGEQYEIVVTTGGGLYRYRTSDCIRVESYRGSIPLISFQYRLGKTSSITGEKLTEKQVLTALNAPAACANPDLARTIVFPRTGEQPHYAILVPESNVPATWGAGDAAAWAADLDKALADVNPEYADKRSSLRLGEPVVVAISDSDYDGILQGFRPSHVGDEQFKPGVLRRENDLDSDVESATVLS